MASLEDENDLWVLVRQGCVQLLDGPLMPMARGEQDAKKLLAWAQKRRGWKNTSVARIGSVPGETVEGHLQATDCGAAGVFVGFNTEGQPVFDAYVFPSVPPALQGELWMIVRNGVLVTVDSQQAGCRVLPLARNHDDARKMLADTSRFGGLHGATVARIGSKDGESVGATLHAAAGFGCTAIWFFAGLGEDGAGEYTMIPFTPETEDNQDDDGDDDEATS